MSFTKIIGELKQNLASKRSELSDQLVGKILRKNLTRFQDKVSISIQDNMATALDSLKEKISKAVFKHIPQWTAYTQNLQLIPNNCRFMHTVENHLVVVVEDAPKPRSLLLHNKLVEGAGKEGSSRHFLALPYVYFILHFKNTKADNSGEWVVQQFYVFWRNQALSSVDDYLYNTVMSNTKPNGAICMSVEIMSKTINDICKEYIDSYYSSVFNSDLSSAWDKKGLIDSRLKTVKSWVEKTKEDHAFVLECNWQVRSTLKEFLNTLVYAKEDELSFKQSINHLMDGFRAEIGNELTKLTSVKFDRFMPKDVLLDITTIFNEHFDKLLSLLEKLENKMDKPTNSFYNVTKVGQSWR